MSVSKTGVPNRTVLISSFEGFLSSFADATVRRVYDSEEKAIEAATVNLWFIRENNRGYFDPLRREAFVRRLRRDRMVTIVSRDGCRYAWRIEA